MAQFALPKVQKAFSVDQRGLVEKVKAHVAREEPVDCLVVVGPRGSGKTYAVTLAQQREGRLRCDRRGRGRLRAMAAKPRFGALRTLRDSPGEKSPSSSSTSAQTPKRPLDF